jgi:iodotyrosine deiodinase
MMSGDSFIPYHYQRLSEEEMRAKASLFHHDMETRRSIRDFSSDPVPKELIEKAILTASSAPSGAHRQPWRFVAICDPNIKKQIRLAVEEEERKSYGERMSKEWLKALEPMGTNWQKPYLETVPWIVVVFEENYRYATTGEVEKNYYVKESVGIACGLFIAAIHQMGLATLTHTPSPMGFLSQILARPENERPYILFPIGYPAVNATVPNFSRKTLDEVTIWFDS